MHLLIQLFLFATSQIAATADTNRYEVTFADTAGTRASVVATIDVGSDLLKVRNGGNSLPHGFATFVSLKSVRDASGASVGFQRDSVSRWRLERRVQRATITYDIDFSFAREVWPSGNEQGAQWDSGALYTVTKPLFVIGDVDAAAEVTFRLPPSWTIATPWLPAAGNPNTFSVPSESALTDNSIVVGRFRADKFSSGPFTFTLASFGRTAAAAPVMARVLTSVAKEYVRIFPATPPTGYLMTVFMGSENDGEAFDQSFAFRIGSPPDQSNSVMWANTLAHELFHFWNGHMLSGSDGIASAWFSEGVTEYYANRTLLRTGALPASAFLAKAENMAGLYTYFRTQPMFDSVSIADAGSRRTRYRFGIYNGGWAVGFALDREISQATAGIRGLDDVMRELFTAHSGGSTQYTMGEVIEISSRVAGKDMAPFFARYVAGRELLPMKELFAGIGVDADFISYTGEGYFRFDPKPTAAQQREWTRYSAGRSR